MYPGTPAPQQHRAGRPPAQAEARASPAGHRRLMGRTLARPLDTTLQGCEPGGAKTQQADEKRRLGTHEAPSPSMCAPSCAKLLRAPRATMLNWSPRRAKRASKDGAAASARRRGILLSGLTDAHADVRSKRSLVRGCFAFNACGGGRRFLSPPFPPQAESDEP